MIDYRVNINDHWLRFRYTTDPICARATWESGEPPLYVSPKMEKAIAEATREFLATITAEEVKAFLLKDRDHA